MSLVTETYPATVMANNDPDQRGRIRISCVGLLGDEEAELPMWVEPLTDWGWFYVPDPGELVDIEVVDSSTQDESKGQASIDNLDIKWRGKRYWGNEEGEQPTPIHDFFKTSYGKQRGFVTPFGHVLVFDDTEGAQRITLTWTSEKGATAVDKISQIIMEKDGTIKLSVLGSHTIHLKEDEVEMRLSDGASLKLTGKDGAATTVLGDGGVKAAIADHLETFYTTTLKVYLEALFVPTGLGPSGPASAGIGPAPPWAPNINSNKLKFPDG